MGKGKNDMSDNIEIIKHELNDLKRGQESNTKILNDLTSEMRSEVKGIKEALAGRITWKHFTWIVGISYTVLAAIITYQTTIIRQVQDATLQLQLSNERQAVNQDNMSKDLTDITDIIKNLNFSVE